MSAEPTVPGVKKILVIDDNLIIQKSLSLALGKSGYQIHASLDVSKALGIVRHEKPDLILLDLTFPLDASDVGGPSKDGFFIIEWLRRSPEAEKIPIIIISGTDPAKYKNQITAAGIIACFRKPLNNDEVLAAIHTALGNSAQADKPN
jgi:CheY-like chemotaxis protein